MIKFKKGQEEEVQAIVLTFSKNLLKVSIDINAYQGNVREILHCLFNIFGWGWSDKLHNFLLGLADYPEREATKKCALTNVEKYYKEGRLRVEKRGEVEKEINKTFDKIKSCNLEIEIDDKGQNKGFIQFTVKKYHRIKVGFTGSLLSDIRLYYPMVDYADPFIDGVTGYFVKGQGITIIEEGCGVNKHDIESGQNKTIFHVREELPPENDSQKLENLKKRLRSIQYVYSEEDASKKQIYKIQLNESNTSTTEVNQ